MLDHEILTPPPPTPKELLAVVAEMYGPPPNPDNPFEDTKAITLKRLAVDILVSSFGDDDPLSQMARVYLNSGLSPYPSPADAEERLSAFNAAAASVVFQLEAATENPL